MPAELPDAETSFLALELQNDALLWDMVYPLEPDVGNDLDALERWSVARFDCVSLTIAGDEHGAYEAFRRVANARNRILERSDQFRLVHDVDDIEAARCEDKLAVALHFEGTRCFERDLSLIEAFARLGVRHALLAFNAANSVGSGCSERADAGLTAWGRQVVAEMQRVGMLVDLSHVGRRTSLDAIEMATRPMVFSHSNADAVTPSFRNLTDEQIRGCAATGGVVGISGSSEYLGDFQVRPEAMFRHIDHIVSLVGPDHVGLGLDVVLDADAVTCWARERPDQWPIVKNPEWQGFRYMHPEDVTAVIELMLMRGYPEDDVRKILGSNHLRVCRAAWGD